MPASMRLLLYASHLSAAFAIGFPCDVARCCWCSRWPCPQDLDLSHRAVVGISLDVAQALDHVHARAHPTENGVLACTQHTRGNKMTVVAVVTDAGVCCLGAWLAPKAYIAATSARPMLIGADTHRQAMAWAPASRRTAAQEGAASAHVHTRKPLITGLPRNLLLYKARLR